ncbi:DNA-processing protein DprA [Limnobacter humi]|uniref:DNA-processing protein DprA n=1 Tax=Limnobacter humi TaxID=1778671 RepID=A0ABT1WDY2_9BURK|nr:DNA-processing protein DprA [Limnobacter humi]MCQ8895589.1 DNA-processing protein DprA [Limnobacter humi]
MNPLLTALNIAYNTLVPLPQRQAAAFGQASFHGWPEHAPIHTFYERAQRWLDEGPNRFWLAPGSTGYPDSLKALPNAPLMLFGHGQAELLHTRSIALVGSRNATRMGLRTAQDLAASLAGHNWTIVSGLAEGIDGAAHTGALDAAGATIAVLGCGPDVVYPSCHHRLAANILASQGLILSEYPPGTAPMSGFFPQRNRIIAALSDALVVVEAAVRSGSLITARLAGNLGKPVLAIPGSIHSSQSKGCHAMIREGAILVETAQQVLDEALAQLPPGKPGPRHSPGVLCTTDNDGVLAAGESATASSPQASGLLKHLDTQAQSVDELAQLAGLSPEDTLCALTELELDGLVLCEAHGRWIRV